jgi:ferredoxin-NADP reductase
MSSHIIKIKSIDDITHDVKKFTCEKPQGYHFNPGQATELSINEPGWEKEARPFTFTSPDDSTDLEFIIKRYAQHKSVTDKLHTLMIGDELIINDTWGAIEYKGAGYFIAGGAGITPFIAILRSLKKQNKLQGNYLFFSNKTEEDIILKDELTSLLGNNVEFSITEKQTDKFHNGQINEQFLKDHITDFTKQFYLCGPPPMIASIRIALENLGAHPDSVVFEK